MSEMVTPTLSLSAPQKVAALSALRDGLTALIDEEKDIVLNFAAEHGVKSFTTAIGTVTVVEKQQDIIIDRVKLVAALQADQPEFLDRVDTVTPEGVAWLKENMPHFVATTFDVDIHMAEAVKKSLTVVDGDVYDANGVPAEYATVGMKPRPYISLPASNGKTQAVDYAKTMLAKNVDALATPVLEA